MTFIKTELSGPPQLAPDVEQVVGTEVQEPRVPDTVLPKIALPEKREIPGPTFPRPALPSAEEIAEQQAIQFIYGIPILKLNRYSGSDLDWVELVRWDIPEGRTGDLREISLLSDNDAATRYRIVLANIDQKIPTDKQTSTPIAFPWRHTVIPGGSSVYVEVLSITGAAINVDGSITGTVR